MLMVKPISFLAMTKSTTEIESNFDYRFETCNSSFSSKNQTQKTKKKQIILVGIQISLRFRKKSSSIFDQMK